MSARLSLRFLPHATAHAQSFFSPAPFELLVQHKFEFHAYFPYDNFSVYAYLEKKNKMK